MNWFAVNAIILAVVLGVWLLLAGCDQTAPAESGPRPSQQLYVSSDRFRVGYQKANMPFTIDNLHLVTVKDTTTGREYLLVGWGKAVVELTGTPKAPTSQPWLYED